METDTGNKSQCDNKNLSKATVMNVSFYKKKSNIYLVKYSITTETQKKRGETRWFERCHVWVYNSSTVFFI